MKPEIEIVRIPVERSQARELADTIESARSGYLAAPRCNGVEVLSSAGNDEVVAIVRWSSTEAHEAALQTLDAAHFFRAYDARVGATGRAQVRPGGGRELMGAVSNEIALVTGGASGIGRAVVERFVAEGYRVGVADIDPQGLASLSALLGDRIVAIEADVATIAGNETAVRATVSAFGKLDVFIGNAGIFDGFAEFADLPIANIQEGYQQIFDINVRGLLLGARASLPHLVRSRGSMIFTLSNSSLYPDGGGVMYVASKHAALGIVRQLAHELAPTVRVNGVAAGATRTPIRTAPAFPSRFPIMSCPRSTRRSGRSRRSRSVQIPPITRAPTCCSPRAPKVV